MKKRITVSIDEEKLKELEVVASREDRSLSNMVEKAIRYYLDYDRLGLVKNIVVGEN